jgi:hypothetical protein
MYTPRLIGKIEMNIFVPLALFSIQQTDLTSFSEDGRLWMEEVLYGYVTNPNPNRNPNSNLNQINNKNPKRNNFSSLRSGSRRKSESRYAGYNFRKSLGRFAGWKIVHICTA